MKRGWGWGDVKKLVGNGFVVKDSKTGEIITAEGIDNGSKKRNKYNARKIVIDGIEFASKKEGCRYRDLKFLQQIGDITDLEVHPQYELDFDGKKVGRYTADFRYKKDGKLIVEDVKSKVTRKKPDYRLRKKMMKLIYDIEILET